MSDNNTLASSDMSDDDAIQQLTIDLRQIRADVRALRDELKRPRDTDFAFPAGDREEQIAWLTGQIRQMRIQVQQLRAELIGNDPVESIEPLENSPEAATPPATETIADTFDYMPVRARFSAYLDREHHLPAGLTRLSARCSAIASAWWMRGQQPEWTPPRPRLWDAIFLTILTVAGLLLRVVNLTSIPPGMHGDEAAVGLGARDAIHDGWIGVYSTRAAGNPTGDFYIAVPFVKWISDQVLAVRLPSVIGGTLAVVLVYAIVRRNAGFTSAAIATFLLAISEWAIQFSRIGFVTGNWLPFALLGTFCLLEANRSRSRWWWAAAGVTTPSALYIYNGHLPVLILIAPLVVIALLGWQFAVGVALFGLLVYSPGPLTIIAGLVGIVIAGTASPARSIRRWTETTAFIVPALLVSRGIFDFARAHHEDYFGRSKLLSVFRTPEWKSLTTEREQSTFLIHRYADYWNLLAFRPIPNGADLSGVTPEVPRLMFWFIAVGFVLAVGLRPSWLIAFSAAILLGAPLISVLTDGATRRSFVILPYACIIGGVGIATGISYLWRRRRNYGLCASIVVTVLLGRIAWVNYDQFFNITVNSQSISATFATDIRSASEYLATLPDATYVLYFNPKSPLLYDTTALIAPNVRGEDRIPAWGGSNGYEIDWSKGTPVFILTADQISRLPDIQALYPGGHTITGPILEWQDAPAYVAYFPPVPTSP